jgi:hypothetical protein
MRHFLTQTQTEKRLFKNYSTGIGYSRHCGFEYRAGQLKLLISLSDETLNRGPAYGCLNTWHAKEPGEASGIGSSFCICNYTLFQKIK